MKSRTQGIDAALRHEPRKGTVWVGFLLAVCLMLGGMTSSQAKADTGVTVPLASVGQNMWVGNASNAGLGGDMQAAGDVNGDGITDLVSKQGGSGSGSTSRGVWVLFTQPGGGSPPDLNNLQPSDGYRMRVTNSSLSITSYGAIGDQNGDGVTDFVVRRANTFYVVYGVADPAADLPKCDSLGVLETRCLDLPALVDLEGNRMGYTISSGVSGDNFGNDYVPGDFDGDGKDEVAFSAFGTDSNRGAAYVVRHNVGDLCPVMPGSCSIDLSTLGSGDVVRIDGPVAGGGFSEVLNVPGDVNGDGRDDLLAKVTAAETTPAAIYVVYGQDWQSSPVGTETFGPSDGFTLLAASGTLVQAPAAAGDANGDGRPDVAVFGATVLALTGQLTVAYTAAETPTTGVPLVPPDAGQGYLVNSTEDDPLSDKLVAAGDLNSDGFDDLTVSNPGATALAVPGAGAVSVLFGQGPDPSEDPLTLGPSITADQGFSLVGDADLQGVGGGAASLGDVDGDGIPDFAVASPNGAGKILLVLGRSLFGNALTGIAGGVSTTAATVAGVVNSHGRASTAYFEYGPTADYGQETDPQILEGDNRNRSVEDDLSGLTPDSEVHYRLVIENDLGLKSFGSDRVFTTDEVPVEPPPPLEPCDEDPTAAGCAKFCEANPTAIGCLDPVAGLSGLIANSASGKVRRGGKVAIRSWITSTGTKSVEGLQVCASAPKRLVRINGKRCHSIGSLEPGETSRVQFTVKVKPKARKGAKPTIQVVASAEGMTTRTAKARFTVR